MFVSKLLAAPTVIATTLSGCQIAASAWADRSDGTAPDLTGATKIELWATRYYLYEAEQIPGAGAIPLRGLSDQVFGPSLSQNDWCNAAIEGSVRVDGQTYSFAGVQDPRQAFCPSHRPSERGLAVRSIH